ncbi:MAG TPA: ATPase [Sphingomicrobium sp.]|nr:ATPase [Sphingomicrobium sp.]
MPQIEQLSEILFSQLFWLLLVFGIIYFVIGRGMVPKIQSVVQAREDKIAADLASAHHAREEAEALEEGYRARMDASRSEAMQLAQASKQEAAKNAEARLRTVDAQVAAKVAEAEERIRASVQRAMAEIEVVAAEAAQELVGKLTGASVSSAEARQAVKAVLHG